MDNNEISARVARAAYTKSSSDYDKLLASLPGVEVYFNASWSKTDSGQGDEIFTPLVTVGPNLKAVVLFTSKDNERLNKNFGGLEWKLALEMVSQDG